MNRSKQKGSVHQWAIIAAVLLAAVPAPRPGCRATRLASRSPGAASPCVPTKIPRRSRPLRFRSRRACLHARRHARPAPVQQAIRPLRHLAPGTRALRNLHQAHGEPRPRGLHRELQRKERQLRSHHDPEKSSTPNIVPSMPRTTAKSTPTNPNPPTEVRQS